MIVSKHAVAVRLTTELSGEQANHLLAESIIEEIEIEIGEAAADILRTMLSEHGFSDVLVSRIDTNHGFTTITLGRR